MLGYAWRDLYLRKGYMRFQLGLLEKEALCTRYRFAAATSGTAESAMSPIFIKSHPFVAMDRAIHKVGQ